MMPVSGSTAGPPHSARSEEHTSESSHGYISYAVFCLKKKKPNGVPVNAIAPGPVYTGRAAPERIEALGATTLQHRAADPPEIAEVVAFLASPRASYGTGAIVVADGGRTAI